MIYSTFNWNTRQYDYWDGPGEPLGIRPRPYRRYSKPPVGGVAPETLVVRVPATARYAGSGCLAVGRIAVKSSGEVGDDGVSDVDLPLLAKHPVATLVGYVAVSIGFFFLAREIGHRV